MQDGERYEDFETATGYGTAEGLCGINCRHNFYPFWPGISERAYTDEKLAELADPAEYEQSQERRALERQVRRYKRQYLAEKAAELDTTRTAAKLRDAQQELAEFIKDTGGKVDGARTSVAGFGSKQSKAAQEDAKAADEQLGIVDKATGTMYHFSEGTHIQNAQTFAGKGGAKPLKEEVAEGLAREFGGAPEDWQHRKEIGWVDDAGESIKAEVHWFQNGKLKAKFKIKRWLYDED